MHGAGNIIFPQIIIFSFLRAADVLHADQHGQDADFASFVENA